MLCMYMCVYSHKHVFVCSLTKCVSVRTLIKCVSMLIVLLVDIFYILMCFHGYRKYREETDRKVRELDKEFEEAILNTERRVRSQVCVCVCVLCVCVCVCVCCVCVCVLCVCVRLCVCAQITDSSITSTHSWVVHTYTLLGSTYLHTPG